MTNKTEMVSVPRELLERLISATKVARGEGSPTQRAAEAILSANPEENEPCPQCGGSLSTWGCNCEPRWPMHKPVAPAEDVRAVVEEPVAWEMDDSAGESGLILVTNDKSLRDEWVRDELPVCPLFSSPQRPVVLPERKPKTELGIYSLEDEGYNACLDDIARLSK